MPASGVTGAMMLDHFAGLENRSYVLLQFRVFQIARQIGQAVCRYRRCAD